MAALVVACGVATASASLGASSGTPSFVPRSFDCAARRAAWAFGKATLPERGDFRTLFDAMELETLCGDTPPAEFDRWTPPNFTTPVAGTVLYCDASAPPGRGDGSRGRPFATVAEAAAAVAAAATGAGEGGAAAAPATIVLRGGIYYERTIELGPQHSGLTIQNFEGEHAVVSGAVPLAAAAGTRGNRSTASPPQWVPASPPGAAPGVWALNVSQLAARGALGEFLGLRLNGSREIRAKFPNGDPEISGAEGWVTAPTQWLKPADKFPDGRDKWAALVDIVSNASSWPGVHWPMAGDVYDCLSLQEDGAAGCGNFHIGSGGFCADLDPPVGYWCSKNPPRGNAYNHTTRDTCGGKYHSCGGTQTHMSPAGLVYAARGGGQSVLPRAAQYRNATGAMVQAWRGRAAWYTNGCIVGSHDRAAGTLLFDPSLGCNQGGEGMVAFGSWWIENVLEELDAPREWFYNHSEGVLYYMPNATAGAPPPAAEFFAATRTKVLFNATGTASAPVADLTLRGLEIRDTALTYYGTDAASRHGMPTGGDWALERAGAVLLEGTSRATVSHCLFERLDGNGIFLSNWNRNATLAHNEMAWIGGTAMAAWGSTGHCLDAACKRRLPWPVGPDARGGQQPRHTRVLGNLVREIGLIQKQSSFWFQAATALSHLEGNVHFNGPRAGVNFNDWMGGGDVLAGNLVANCVRESGDHGPWNSWDRVPYITDIGLVADPSRPPGDHRAEHPGHTLANATHPSITPRFRQVRNNFILGTYNTLFTIDTDDGSGYLQAHNNFFLYGGGGLKSFFGGQWQHHWQNVYAYVGGNGCYWTGVNVAFFDNYCVAQVAYPDRLKFAMDPATGCPLNTSYFGDTMTVYNNTILTPTGRAAGPICRGVAGTYPSDAELIGRGTAATAPYPRPAPRL